MTTAPGENRDPEAAHPAVRRVLEDWMLRQARDRAQAEAKLLESLRRVQAETGLSDADLVAEWVTAVHEVLTTYVTGDGPVAALEQPQ